MTGRPPRGRMLVAFAPLVLLAALGVAVGVLRHHGPSAADPKVTTTLRSVTARKRPAVPRHVVERHGGTLAAPVQDPAAD